MTFSKLNITYIKQFFFFSFFFLLAGCFSEFTRTQVFAKTFDVDGYMVEEVIYREDGFPDFTFERVYRVRNGRSWTSLGSFSNESQDGITVLPEWVDGRLVVYSSAHLFIWQPDSEPLHFSPFDADGWVAFSEQFGTFGINGHYDVLAQDFWIEEGVWFIEYNCVRCQGGKPESILFTSDDAGQTFDINQE